MDSFRPACPPIPVVTDEGFALIFRDGKLLVKATGGGLSLCASWPRALPRVAAPGQYIGTLKDRPCHVYDAPPLGTGARAKQGPPGYAFRELRALFGLLTEDEYAAAVTAAEVLHFHQTFRRCPSCGKELVPVPERWLRRCVPCGVDLEPRAQPTVIGLIHDGEQILVARPHGLPREMFSLPATSVGPGENMEQALSHFVDHSLGVHIDGPVYYASQPWPYPDRLVIGLHAHATATELRVDDSTFSAARWCHIDELPPMPAPISLARRMADWYVQLPRVAGRPALPRH